MHYDDEISTVNKPNMCEGSWSKPPIFQSSLTAMGFSLFDVYGSWVIEDLPGRYSASIEGTRSSKCKSSQDLYK